MITSSTPASFTASMISRWYGARSVFHCPGSADASWDSFLYLSAQPLTVSSGGGESIFAISLKRRTVFPSTFISPRSSLSSIRIFISLCPLFITHKIISLKILRAVILQFVQGIQHFPVNCRADISRVIPGNQKRGQFRGHG